MRLLPQRWDPWDRPTVRPLTHEDEPALRAMIAQDPVAHLFAAEHLQRIGLPRSSMLTGRRAASPFLGVFGPASSNPESESEGSSGSQPAHRLMGACWFGANLVPVVLDPAHLAPVADYVRSSRRDVSSIFGPAQPVLGLWDRLGRAGFRAFDVRPEQPLLLLDQAASLPVREDRPADRGLSAVRWAREGDLPRLLPAAVAMFTEEVGYSPLSRDPDGYRQRVAQGVRERRTVLATDAGGSVVFKTDIGLAADSVCQLQGVWLDPRWRGRGLSEPLLRQACALIGARYDEISLYVNAYNAPARALYRAVGFRRAGTFATILF